MDQDTRSDRLVDLGLAHIYFLIGARNRLAVALNWLWIYASGDRSARLITQGERQPKLP
jgi:NADH dehydrogenase